MMKCYILAANYNKTHSGLTWGTTQNGDSWDFGPNPAWSPLEDVSYEIGGNTWAATGALTQDSKDKLAGFWAHACGSEIPLSEAHVIGQPGTKPYVDTMVRETFVKAMTDLDPTLFDFTRHDKVWDPDRDCAPWDGEFFMATLLQVVPTFELELTEITPQSFIVEKYRGAHIPAGGRRVVRASKIAGRLVWRDSYTRYVLCTQPFLDALQKVGVTEWEVRQQVEVLNDLN